MKPRDTPNLPPRNPFLMPESFYNQAHWNPAATAVSEEAAWTGTCQITDQDYQWLPTPAATIGAAFHTYPDGEEAAYFSGADRVGKIRLTNGAFELVDYEVIHGYENVTAPKLEIRHLVNDMVDAGINEDLFLPKLKDYLSRHETSGDTILNGAYTLLDRDRNYFAGWGTTLYKIADEAPSVSSEIKIVASYDLSDLPVENEISRLSGVGMTYDGHIVVAMPGIVAVLDRDLNVKDYKELETDEVVENGVTTDVAGGIYVVTSKYMRKLVWDGSALSIDAEGTWKCEYEVKSNPKALSHGSGTTPTLMGFEGDPHKLVIIADAGSEISVVAFWRDDIPEGFEPTFGTDPRIAGQKVLSFRPPATIEWSPQVYGYETLFFASSWPDPVSPEWPSSMEDGGELDLYATVLTAGVSREAPRGAEKLIWNPETFTFTTGWTNDSDLQWALHPISASSGTVHLCGVEDGYYNLIAIDWESGEVVGKTILGFNPIFNAMGGAFIPMANGDLYMTGTFGPLRISRPEAVPR